MKKRQKKKHCHGLTRNFTEISIRKGRSRDTEIRPRISRSICHGRTRNYTEKTEAETRKRRIKNILDTEFHGRKIYFSEPDA